MRTIIATTLALVACGGEAFSNNTQVDPALDAGTHVPTDGGGGGDLRGPMGTGGIPTESDGSASGSHSGSSSGTSSDAGTHVPTEDGPESPTDAGEDAAPVVGDDGGPGGSPGSGGAATGGMGGTGGAGAGGAAGAATGGTGGARQGCYAPECPRCVNNAYTDEPCCTGTGRDPWDECGCLVVEQISGGTRFGCG